MAKVQKKKNIYKFWFGGKQYSFTAILTRQGNAWENLDTDIYLESNEYDYDEHKEDRFWYLQFQEGEFIFEFKFKKFKGDKEDWQFDKPFEVVVWEIIDGDEENPIPHETLTWTELSKKPNTKALTNESKAKRKKLERVNELKRA